MFGKWQTIIFIIDTLLTINPVTMTFINEKKSNHRQYMFLAWVCHINNTVPEIKLYYITN
jgi:hypothetical protein